jgi:uncharacterized protein YbaR (Trm112 family)
MLQPVTEWSDIQPLIREYTMDKKLLEILVCPVSKAPLIYSKKRQELICKVGRLAYPIRNGVPVMLESEARRLADDEEV